MASWEPVGVVLAVDVRLPLGAWLRVPDTEALAVGVAVWVLDRVAPWLRVLDWLVDCDGDGVATCDGVDEPDGVLDDDGDTDDESELEGLAAQESFLPYSSWPKNRLSTRSAVPLSGDVRGAYACANPSSGVGCE